VQQALDRGLDQRSAVLARDHHPGLHVAALDHPRDDDHRVEEAQARVGEVERLAAGLEPQRAVHDAGRRRLQEVAADGRVHEHAHALARHAARRERALPGARRHAARARVRRPQAPLADAGQELQATGGQGQPLVQGRQPRLDLGRGDHAIRERVGEAGQGHLGEAHAGAGAPEEARGAEDRSYASFHNRPVLEIRIRGAADSCG
jgi:hypothetical protein